jgi:hypothetical protein
MSAPTESTTFQAKLVFPDAKARDDAEIALRGWLKEWQQRATISRAVKEAREGDEGDATGFLFGIYEKDGSLGKGRKIFYINAL